MRGSLFTQDFLGEGVTEQAEWLAIGDEDVAAFADNARAIFSTFPVTGDPEADIQVSQARQ